MQARCTLCRADKPGSIVKHAPAPGLHTRVTPLTCCCSWSFTSLICSHVRGPNCWPQFVQLPGNYHCTSNGQFRSKSYLKQLSMMLGPFHPSMFIPAKPPVLIKQRHEAFPIVVQPQAPVQAGKENTEWVVLSARLSGTNCCPSPGPMGGKKSTDSRQTGWAKLVATVTG